MKYLAFLIFISNTWAADFIPQSFRANFEQSFKSAISGKVKVSQGSIDYLYPGKIRFEIMSPDQTIFVSNGVKSWYYTAPFDLKEKGELVVQPANKLLITKFFDHLKKGLDSNENYAVVKDKDFYKVSFKPEVQKQLGIESAKLYSDKEKAAKLSDLQKMIIIYTDKKEVTLTLSQIIDNVKFDKSYFDFKAPKNTKETSNL